MKMTTQLIGAALLGLLSTAAMAEQATTKTVAAVHTEFRQLSGQQVHLSGKVVKVNNGIMRRNFVHLEDGTGNADTKRLIITSTDTAKVGDEVEVVGSVKLDTDFGMGYFYPLLIENARITLKK